MFISQVISANCSSRIVDVYNWLFIAPLVRLDSSKSTFSSLLQCSMGDEESQIPGVWGVPRNDAQWFDKEENVDFELSSLTTRSYILMILLLSCHPFTCCESQRFLISDLLAGYNHGRLILHEVRRISTRRLIHQYQWSHLPYDWMKNRNDVAWLTNCNLVFREMEKKC